LSAFLLFSLGLVFLIVGAEALVRGAVRLASALRISPLVVGLTVVAFGTSSPEMAVSVQSALAGGAGADIAVGNVVGSNIFNVLFILGVSATLVPLRVSQQLVRVDVPIMIGVSVMMLVLAWDGTITRWNGLTLVAGVIAYTVFAIYQSRKESQAVHAEYQEAYGPVMRRGRFALSVLLIPGGLAMLVVGSRWLVDGALIAARLLGLSELVVGLTIVAAGTSLPEVATSVVASLRGERDIAVGNVVGSNIFNILAVLGSAAAVAPAGVNVSPSALGFDIPVMIAVAVACLPIFFTGFSISRWEGLLFLGYYVAYTAFLILDASGQAVLRSYSVVMLCFVIPLTIVTVSVSVIREVRSHGGNEGKS
jgi:cation:H+ antiporter